VRRLAVTILLASHPDNKEASPRTKRFVRYGASPRGAQAMVLAAKVRAILDQRYHVAREDLLAVAHAALRHRLILNFEGQAENVQPDQIVDDILTHLRLPAPTRTPRPVPGARSTAPAASGSTTLDGDATRPPVVADDVTRAPADKDANGAAAHPAAELSGDQTRAPVAPPAGS
jgi:hypothetical protein